ncbi:MAG: hypothetical protein WBZ29_01120 [Methanocella sp.]
MALYEEYVDNATILEGNGTVLYIPVPCPVPHPFDYNGSQGFREQYPAVNDDLKIMYGTYNVYSHPAGSYSTARYRGIYALPFTLDSGLVIREIDASGTIYAADHGMNTTLKVGDTWRSMDVTLVKNESLPLVSDNSSFSNLTYRPFSVRHDYSCLVENKGIFPKSNIL